MNLETQGGCPGYRQRQLMGSMGKEPEHTKDIMTGKSYAGY